MTALPKPPPGPRPACEIRCATLDDVDAIFAIEIVSFSCPWPRDAFETEIDKQAWSRVVVAQQDGVVVGFMVYWLVVDEMQLSNIAVLPMMRRRGVARALLDYLIWDGVEAGKRVLFLEVRTSNEAAINLYRNYGFIDLDMRKGYYADNGEDALVMVLKLNEMPSLKRRTK